MNNYTMSNGGLSMRDGPIYLCDLFDFSTITGVFFILVFILSVIVNVLLLFVIFTYETLTNVTNLFVLNLAFSDLVFTSTLPFVATYYLHHWVFGDFLCKFVIAAYFVGLYSSVILLTAMTVDRFIIVVLHKWPNNYVRRQRCAVVVCVAAWCISIGTSFVEAINVKATYQQDTTMTCESISQDDGFKLGAILQLSLLFLLPFAIIVFCYCAILKTVLQCSNRKKYRTVVVVFCIVAAFFICWGPYNVMVLFDGFETYEKCNVQQSFHIAYHICLILAYSHCCMNPLLYLLSQKLRKHLLHILPCQVLRNKEEERGPTTVIQTAPQSSAVILEMQAQ
ncbi:chemokine XC receptor 1-like [Solea senegalensis]|uniref:Chemokine XC receptor 1-like n=1 Tax=Solea senegalensis TaxID=28829 RepID=A0AAV6TBX7_SOLSE|nr:chemokine XC receptor 1-like [Solea senegalensis]KAG7526887.1 chemokine XC receptor 1-like [Solea senegalensis]